MPKFDPVLGESCGLFVKDGPADGRDMIGKVLPSAFSRSLTVKLACGSRMGVKFHIPVCAETVLSVVLVYFYDLYSSHSMERQVI